MTVPSGRPPPQVGARSGLEREPARSGASAGGAPGLEADASPRDRAMMGLALEAAARAASVDEVPVGAVLTVDDRVVVVAHNERELTRDPTAHAELLAMRRAARILGRWRLHDATVYVTLEPCPMCAGALVNARVRRLVYGADDPKAGAVGSLYAIATDARLNHRLAVTAGVERSRCSELLRGYFRAKRGR